MTVLLLLNGPPASGKSTLAGRLVAKRPLALNLDVDIIRGQIGGWRDAPTRAGLVARQLALTMAQRHLDAGHSVVIPQFLAKLPFIEQLEETARVSSATFAEVVLTLDRADAIAAFQARSAAPESQTHRDADVLVQASSAGDPIGDMCDELQSLVAQRPNALRVSVERGDIDATCNAVIGALVNAKIVW